MTTLREAAQQALEALEYENSWHKPRNEKPYVSTLDAITALKAALAEPEPPPEAQTEAERVAYAAGWWKALEVNREKQAEPVQEPVAHLWQQSGTGRTRVVTPDRGITSNDGWRMVGPLYLAPPQPLNLNDPAVQKRLAAQWGYVDA